MYLGQQFHNVLDSIIQLLASQNKFDQTFKRLDLVVASLEDDAGSRAVLLRRLLHRVLVIFVHRHSQVL